MVNPRDSATGPLAGQVPCTVRGPVTRPVVVLAMPRGGGLPPDAGRDAPGEGCGPRIRGAGGCGRGMGSCIPDRVSAQVNRRDPGRDPRRDFSLCRGRVLAESPCRFTREWSTRHAHAGRHCPALADRKTAPRDREARAAPRLPKHAVNGCPASSRPGESSGECSPPGARLPACLPTGSPPDPWSSGPPGVPGRSCVTVAPWALTSPTLRTTTALPLFRSEEQTRKPAQAKWNDG